MNTCVSVIEDIFHQCMHDTYARKLVSTIGKEDFHRERIYLSIHDYSYLRSCKYNQTSAYIFDEYAEHAIHHIQFFRDSCEEKGNIIKEDWSNVDLKEFDEFSENMGYETATATIARSFSYTSTSSCYNTNRKDFMGFVRVIEDIFQQSMNDPVARTLIAKTGTQSIRSVLELSYEDIDQLNFGVYDKTLPILTYGADYLAIRLLHCFHSSREKYGSPIKEDWSNVTCEEFDECCANRGYTTTTSIEEEHIIEKHILATNIPSVIPVQRMCKFDIANFDIMVDIISETDQIFRHITQALLIYTGDNKSYNDVISMSFLEIDKLHYVVESLETRCKQPPLNQAKTEFFEAGNPVMEEFTLKTFIPLPAGNKAQLKAFGAYLTYRRSINDPLNESLSNLKYEDYTAFRINRDLYDPDVQTPAPNTTSQSGSKYSSKSTTTLSKVDNFQADDPSVTSIYLVQSDESFATNEHDQINKEPCTDNIIIACCHGEKGCVNDSLSNIFMGGNRTKHHYDDKQTKLPTVSLNFNYDGTSNNKVENNNNINDSCFDSNPSDSYCAYRDSYNAINKETIAINWNGINSAIIRTDSSSFTTRANINVPLGGKYKSIISSFTGKHISLLVKGTPPDQYVLPMQTEKCNEFPFDPGETSVAHINNDLHHLVTACWKNSNLLNLKQTKEISIGEYQHECLFIDKVVRYLFILKKNMQVKETNMSIIYGHGEYQTLYLDMTIGVDTSATHVYGELQIVYKNSIRDYNTKVKHVHGELQMVNKHLNIDNNPRVQNVHGELQTLYHNVIDDSSLHTDYGEINHLCKFRCSKQALLHQSNSNPSKVSSLSLDENLLSSSHHHYVSNIIGVSNSLTFHGFKIYFNNRSQQVTLKLGHHSFMKDTTLLSLSTPATMIIRKRIYYQLYEIYIMMHNPTHKMIKHPHCRSKSIKFGNVYSAYTYSHNSE